MDTVWKGWQSDDSAWDYGVSNEEMYEVVEEQFVRDLEKK